MAQFGIHGDPKISAQWKDKKLKDDPVKKSNMRGYLSFATSGIYMEEQGLPLVVRVCANDTLSNLINSGPDTRTTQIFINFGDNSNLDRFNLF